MNTYRYVQKFWTLFFSICVYGDIIREDNHFKAEFSNIHKGRMTRVLMVFNDLPLPKCMVKYIQYISCKTVNYNFGKMMCELTDVDFNNEDADRMNSDWYNYGTKLRAKGDWGRWRNVTRCTATCNRGTMNQARDCETSNPQRGDDDCVGNGERTIDCNTQPCPVNGNWGAWRNATTCRCKGGTIQQTRQCDSPPPQYGGDNCTGDSRRRMSCSAQNCPSVNVALSKPATQSSTLRNKFTSRGNDGDMDTSSATNREYQPWWEVDLGANMELDFMLFRSSKEYRWVYVHVRRDSATSFKVCKVLKSTKAVVVRFSCESREEARYVKIILTTDGSLHIKEFQVYVKPRLTG